MDRIVDLEYLELWENEIWIFCKGDLEFGFGI